ncbi:uncharacterized protein LOC124270295 [Haliotis rubra]|uniref:uncharacterized protein LOC124270295 n=1 Tax=Haliotis rubra TaxID=36100 RepID=UPI001EE58C11|nr:uncharacterized protein LOC124270295 [Haliotis rubra]
MVCDFEGDTANWDMMKVRCTLVPPEKMQARATRAQHNGTLYRQKLKHIGEKRKDEEEQFGEVKTRKYDALNYVAAPFELKTNICVEPQQFNIQTKDFFLPSLQQIGDSIKDIREFYCPRGKLSIVPKSLTASLKRITEKLVTFLQEETFSLSQNSGLIDTAKPRLLQETDGFIFIAKTLCFPLNIPYSELPSDIRCDIVLMLPSQPAFVLTVVDNDTTEAKKYVSVARGLITSLNRFIDDDFSAVFGVVCKSHLDSWDTFQSKLKTLAHSCSRFVTFDSLYMSEGKYDKLITSFWASVAKVEPGDQFPDAERINFLTKEQCTVLLENMNSKYVFVLTLPKCGGTTLMLEVARRLQNFLPTYLMVKSVEDKSKYRGLCESVSTALISESPAITDVLDNNCESERAAVTESILPLHDHETIKITWTFYNQKYNLC